MRLASGYIRFSQAESPRNLPVAIDLHDAAELAIGGGMKAVVDGAIGDGAAEIDVAAIIHGANQFQVAQGALELRERDAA